MLIVINKHFEFFHLLISWIFVKRNEASTNTCACLQKKSASNTSRLEEDEWRKNCFFSTSLGEIIFVPPFIFILVGVNRFSTHSTWNFIWLPTWKKNYYEPSLCAERPFPFSLQMWFFVRLLLVFFALLPVKWFFNWIQFSLMEFIHYLNSFWQHMRFAAFIWMPNKRKINGKQTSAKKRI